MKLGLGMKLTELNEAALVEFAKEILTTNSLEQLKLSVPDASVGKEATAAFRQAVQTVPGLERVKLNT